MNRLKKLEKRTQSILPKEALRASSYSKHSKTTSQEGSGYPLTRKPTRTKTLTIPGMFDLTGPSQRNHHIEYSANKKKEIEKALTYFTKTFHSNERKRKKSIIKFSNLDVTTILEASRFTNGPILRGTRVYLFNASKQNRDPLFQRKLTLMAKIEIKGYRSSSRSPMFFYHELSNIDKIWPYIFTTAMYEEAKITKDLSEVPDPAYHLAWIDVSRAMILSGSSRQNQGTHQPRAQKHSNSMKIRRKAKVRNQTVFGDADKRLRAKNRRRMQRNQSYAVDTTGSSLEIMIGNMDQKELHQHTSTNVFDIYSRQNRRGAIMALNFLKKKLLVKEKFKGVFSKLLGGPGKSQEVALNPRRRRRRNRGGEIREMRTNPISNDFKKFFSMQRTSGRGGTSIEELVKDNEYESSDECKSPGLRANRRRNQSEDPYPPRMGRSRPKRRDTKKFRTGIPLRSKTYIKQPTTSIEDLGAFEKQVDESRGRGQPSLQKNNYINGSRKGNGGLAGGILSLLNRQEARNGEKINSGDSPFYRSVLSKGAGAGIQGILKPPRRNIGSFSPGKRGRKDFKIRTSEMSSKAIRLRRINEIK